MAKTGAVDRRNFLKGAAVTGAAALVPDAAAGRRGPSGSPGSASSGSGRPGRRTRDGSRCGPRSRSGGRGRRGNDRPARWRLHGGCPSSRSTSNTSRRNPGSSFRGIHESIINYGNNQAPEFLTCLHEESSVAMAHGYFKVEGKPMGRAVSRHGRPPARGDGHLQRLLRPRAGVHPRGQPSGRDDAAARCGMGAQRAGRGRHGPRFRQVGRCAGLVAALRRVRRARLQDRDDATDDAGRRGGSTANSRRIRFRRRWRRGCASQG